jgi:hypothetical protein
MRLDELMQPGWGDAADYICERYMKHGKTELKVPAVVKPQTDMTALTPSQTTSAKIMQMFEIIPGQLQMLQVTSRPECCEMRLRLEQPQAHSHMPI